MMSSDIKTCLDSDFSCPQNHSWPRCKRRFCVLCPILYGVLYSAITKV